MELKELWRKQKLKGVFVQTVDSPAMPLIAQQAGMDFIFYDIDAKTSDEIKHRSKEEEETLERGIAKIYALLEKKAA